MKSCSIQKPVCRSGRVTLLHLYNIWAKTPNIDERTDWLKLVSKNSAFPTCNHWPFTRLLSFSKSLTRRLSVALFFSMGDRQPQGLSFRNSYWEITAYKMIPLIPSFFWHPIITQVLSGNAFSQPLFSKHAEFLWVGNAPESSSTLTYMWGVFCVFAVCRHSSMCCVYMHTSHAHVLCVSCVMCMLSILYVPMSHACDWMHTSMSLCVHIYVDMCLCVHVYLYVLYPLVHSHLLLGLTWAMHFPWQPEFGSGPLSTLYFLSQDSSHFVLSAIHMCVSHRSRVLCYPWT